jgi:hypothetical protein
VREKAICAIHAVAMWQVLRAQLVLLELRDERLLLEVRCRGHETEAAAAGRLGIELWSRQAVICWNECLRCWIHRGLCAEALAWWSASEYTVPVAEFWSSCSFVAAFLNKSGSLWAHNWELRAWIVILSWSEHEINFSQYDCFY